MSFAMCSLTRAQHAGGYAFSSPLEVERWSPKTRCNITLFCCIRCKPLILRALCCIPAPCALPTAHRVQSTGFRTHEWKAKRGTGVRGKVLITGRIGGHFPRAQGGGRGVRAYPFPEPQPCLAPCSACSMRILFFIFQWVPPVTSLPRIWFFISTG